MRKKIKDVSIMSKLQLYTIDIVQIKSNVDINGAR